jgi:hypothetical protein
MDKIRFSLGYVDAKQLAKRLDKLALDILPDKDNVHRSAWYIAEGERMAKSLFIAWVRARYDVMNRWDIATLVQREMLPSVSRKSKAPRYL